MRTREVKVMFSFSLGGGGEKVGRGMHSLPLVKGSRHTSTIIVGAFDPTGGGTAESV